MSTQKNFLRVILLVLALLGAPFFNPFADDAAQAQDDCKTKFTRAETAFNNGRLDETIDLLSDCVYKGKLAPAEEQRAIKLLSFSYLAKDYVDQAKNTIRKLLELVPSYEPDPNQDPPDFARMVKEVKTEMTAPGAAESPAEKTTPPVKKKKSKTWLFVGGGAVVAGGVAALALGGGGGGGPVPQPTPLPTPPPLP
jgi:hypothetical protein